MGSWLFHIVSTGMVFFFISPLSPLFALSFCFPPLSNSALPFGFWDLYFSSFYIFGLLLLLSGYASFIRTYKIAKTLTKFKKELPPRITRRRNIASSSTRARQHSLLVLKLLQVSSALPRTSMLSDKHVDAMRHFNCHGVLSVFDLADRSVSRFVIMCSWFLVAGGVILAFGPGFASAAGTLYPGKEDWLERSPL